MKKLLKIIMCLTIVLALFGCNGDSEMTSQSDEDIKQEIDEKAQEAYEAIQVMKLENFYEASPLNSYNDKPNMYENETAKEAFKRYREFAIKDFYFSLTEGENEIVSPLSLYYALAILANAAEGHTKEEMETALGMTVDDLNQFLYELDELYVNSYSNSDMYTPSYLKANGLWFNSDLGKLKTDYVETIKKYYGNSINEGSFSNKQKTVEEVNNWASDKTQDAIKEIVKESDLQDDTIFLILNALTAGGLWVFPFDSAETYYQEFNCYDNSHKMVEMMHETIFGHWSDEKSEGFVKELWNGNYFIAIIPNLGVDIYDYINLMDESTLKSYKENVHYEDVVGSFIPDYATEEYPYECPIVDQHYTNLSFPKFSFEKEYDLEKTIKKFGLKNIFDYKTCDFSKMADEALYVQKIKQKCRVEVDEEKAIASAVTLVSGGRGGGDCIQVRDNIYHNVIFDRPFLFAFVDGYNAETILFMGVVNDIGGEVENATKIENIAGKINIRNAPSTEGEKVGSFEKGQISYSFETKEAEGYTWYRIGTDKWIADKKGEWIKVLN